MTHSHRSAPADGRRLPSGLFSAPTGVLGLVLRMGLGLLAFVLVLGALLVGAVLALGLVAWALVRGRRPSVQVFSSSFQRMRRPAAGSGSGRSAPAAAGAVIDIEAREVPDNGRPDAPLRPAR
jgi:hypothetical protein